MFHDFSNPRKPGNSSLYCHTRSGTHQSIDRDIQVSTECFGEGGPVTLGATVKILDVPRDQPQTSTYKSPCKITSAPSVLFPLSGRCSRNSRSTCFTSELEEYERKPTVKRRFRRATKGPERRSDSMAVRRQRAPAWALQAENTSLVFFYSPSTMPSALIFIADGTEEMELYAQLLNFAPVSNPF